MAELSRIRNAGFKVRLLDDDTIGITPIASLTEVQRQWIITYKPALLAELKAEAANAPDIRSTTFTYRTIPLQTCGSCGHFERIEHPRLGHCAINAQIEAVCGLWDTDHRDYCEQFSEVAA